MNAIPTPCLTAGQWIAQARDKLTRPLPRPSQPQFSSSESETSDDEAGPYRGAQQPSPESSELLISNPGAVDHESVSILHPTPSQKAAQIAAESPYSPHAKPASETGKAPSATAKPASVQQMPKSVFEAGGRDSLLPTSQAGAGSQLRQQSGAAVSPEGSQAVSRSIVSVHPSDSTSNSRGQQGPVQRHRWTDQDARATQKVLEAHGKDWVRLQVRI